MFCRFWTFLQLLYLKLYRIFCCKIELLMYFKSTNFNKTLSAFLNIDEKVIYFMCLTTLASLLIIEIIQYKHLNTLLFSTEEVSSFVEILCEASTEPDITARKVFGSCVVPVEDTLILFQHFCYVEPMQQSYYKGTYMFQWFWCPLNYVSTMVQVIMCWLLLTCCGCLSVSFLYCLMILPRMWAHCHAATIDSLAKKKDKSYISSITLCIQYTCTDTYWRKR